MGSRTFNLRYHGGSTLHLLRATCPTTSIRCSARDGIHPVVLRVGLGRAQLSEAPRGQRLKPLSARRGIRRRRDEWGARGLTRLQASGAHRLRRVAAVAAERMGGRRGLEGRPVSGGHARRPAERSRSAKVCDGFGRRRPKEAQVRPVVVGGRQALPTARTRTACAQAETERGSARGRGDVGARG